MINLYDKKSKGTHWVSLFVEKNTAVTLMLSKLNIFLTTYLNKWETIWIDEELAEELHKSVIKKFKERKVYATFKDNILTADLSEMESLPSENQNVSYLLCVRDVFTKYACVKHLKDKNGNTALNAFVEIVDLSNRKPNKLWFDQGREYYNKFMQKWLNNIMKAGQYLLKGL